MNQISAFLEAKMLFLCLFLLSCCLSLSAGNEIEEFKENLEAFVNLTKKQIFLPILKKNECKCAHDYLSNTEKYLEKLTEKFNDEPKAKERLRLMRFNMKQLMHRLEKGDKVNPSKSCGKTEVGLRRALKFYKGFFERLNEFNCIKSQ